jgi:hypothetical protein
MFKLNYRFAALKALSGPKVTSRLVAECQDALLAVADLNEFTLIWVPEHHGIPDNEQAYKLARQASTVPLLGPEPALGTPRCWVRETIKKWTELQHYNTWTKMPGCQAKSKF